MDENSLLLLDEPDTYLHPKWQSSFLKGIYEVINLYNDLALSLPQFIIASHSTIMLSNLSSGDLFKMSEGKAATIDKGYYGRVFETELANVQVTLIRPARQGEPAREDARFLKPLRQRIESVFDTLKGQLGLEQHGGRTPGGVIVRVLQRLLALTAAIWHNHRTGQPILRSLTAYDH